MLPEEVTNKGAAKWFSINLGQANKLAEWQATLPKPPPTAIGGAFTYCFTQTGIGQIVVVEYYDGQKIDLTEYEDW